VKLSNSNEIAAASGDGNADQAMARIGTGLKACIRAVDHLFRLRRDEFCILLPETDGDGAGYVLRRLEGQIASGKLWADDVVPRPQIQIGLTSTPDERIKSGDDLLQQTRRSLAKKS
jgi:GGDEF domain-containing protein